jgi:serine/threonine protein kinase
MEIIEQIEFSHGGFGKVEKITHKDGTFYARKIFDPIIKDISKEEIEKSKERFKKEIRVQSVLDSTIALPVIEYDIADDKPWFIMPFAEFNFRDEIKKSQASNIPPTQSLIEILDALSNLHAIDLVHRDLKPENILYYNNKWVLADFGLVMVPSLKYQRLTGTKSQWHSERYCAPEQAESLSKATPKTDIFAFGCILHDLFSGKSRVPYQQCTYDGYIGEIIRRCTEIDPCNRYESTLDLKEALISALAQQPFSFVEDESIFLLEELKAFEQSPIDLINFSKFMNYISTATRETKHAFFTAISKKVISNIIQIRGWEDLLEEYCVWVASNWFDFNFCDTLTDRMILFFNAGKISQKAMIISALSELGSSHNRFYTVKTVVDLTNNEIDANVAKRTAIEIQLAERGNAFANCYRVDRTPYSSMHPDILKSIEKRYLF